MIETKDLLKLGTLKEIEEALQKVKEEATAIVKKTLSNIDGVVPKETVPEIANDPLFLFLLANGADKWLLDYAASRLYYSSTDSIESCGNSIWMYMDEVEDEYQSSIIEEANLVILTDKSKLYILNPEIVKRIARGSSLAKDINDDILVVEDFY